MKKRLFIHLVRQYAQHAVNKKTDYTVLVEKLLQERLGQLSGEGVSQAELDKEESWMRGFVAREFTPYVPEKPRRRVVEPEQG